MPLKSLKKEEPESPETARGMVVARKVVQQPEKPVPTAVVGDFGCVGVPVRFDSILDLQQSSVCSSRFNRWGTVVAFGTIDGRVFIVDFSTKNIVTKFTAHVMPVSTLSWSRDGRSLLTASFDRTCVLWDVLTGRQIARMSSAHAILTAHINPRDDNQLLILPNGRNPQLRWVSTKISKVCAAPQLEVGCVCCAVYDRRGQYVICGTGDGKIVIYDVATQNLLSIVKQNSGQVRDIVVPRSGCYIFTNSMDHVIRRFDLDQLINGGIEGDEPVEPIQKLSCIVGDGFSTICCSHDGRYICGGSNQSHSLYIWDCTDDSLVKVLRGVGTQGERLQDVQWSPAGPVVLSIANGVASVWMQAVVENWAAFAPEFTILEANSEYIEAEGEYDEEDEDEQEVEEEEGDDKEIVERKEEDVDVVTVKMSELACSSDEEDVNLPRLPAKTGPLWMIVRSPEIDNPEYRYAAAAAGPYADRAFLRQPAGGMPMQYEVNDVRRQFTNASVSVATAKKMVTKQYRSFE